MNKKKNNSSKVNFPSKVRSKYILKQIFDYLNKYKLLQIIRYNKNLRKEFNINNEDYKIESWKIEIQLILKENARGKFINIRKGHESYFKIYFNDSKQERKEQRINKKDKVGRIKIIIDHQNNAFYGLFKECKCIKKIKFIKFNRNDIINMSLMFCECSSLEDVDLSHFNTENVTKMSKMFYGCTSLKKLNLSKFKTNKLKDMNSMFERCSLLKELNLSSFNTSNVTDMDFMFSWCSSLVELDLSNFKTNNVNSMLYLFGNCSSLKKLNIFNFVIKDENINHMFDNCPLLKEIICSDELKMKIIMVKQGEEL